MEELEKMLRERTGDPEGYFSSGHVLQDGVWRKKYMLEFHFRKKKRDGEYTAKLFSVLIIMKVDPFTGARLHSDGEEKLDEHV